MKIGFLLPGHLAIGSPYNGVREQANYQAQALIRLGHDVVCLNPWDRHVLEDFDVIQFFVGGLEANTIGIRPAYGIRLLAFAPTIDSNVSFRWYRLAARMGNLFAPIYTIPGSLSRQARTSDVVIARSSYERQRLIQGLGADPNKVKIVLNGVTSPKEADPEQVRERYKLPDEFLLHISTYTHERKNVVRFIQAVGPMGIPVVIAGVASPGPVLDRLRQLCERYPQIKMLGRVDDDTRNGLYAACRVFCLPSRHEGTGLVALEAASYGAAIVITKNGGPPDYFLDMAEYVNDDQEDIRAAVERAWEQPPSTALRDHVVNNLSWESSAQRLIDIYRCDPGL